MIRRALAPSAPSTTTNSLLNGDHLAPDDRAG